MDQKFLGHLATGGFAERLSKEQRRELHIESNFDEYLKEALQEGKQVVLTGNPGDGKTQYILMNEDEFSDAFYLKDASTYEDYEVLLEKWHEELDKGRKGILAINDGPLHEMITKHRADFDFLKNVEKQLENQTVVGDSVPELDTEDIVVINLGNRNILHRKVILRALKRLTNENLDIDLDRAEETHITYNIKKLQNEEVQGNFIDLLKTVGKLDEHFTIRDLLNFLAYCITGGRTEGEVNFDEELKYYNLAFTGEGKISKALRKEFAPQKMNHPFIDKQLWAETERKLDIRDTNYDQREVFESYIQEKRRFIFEDHCMDIGYDSNELFHFINYSFNDFMNGEERSNSVLVEEIIERINSYFVPNMFQRDKLITWFSHNYRSKNTKVLVSRTEIDNHKFERNKPKLHPEISSALDKYYYPDFALLEYDNGENKVRLKIDRNLFDSLDALDSNIPYTLRSKGEERRILEFMEKLDREESTGESTGLVRLKDTETGKMKAIQVNDDRYKMRRI